MSNPTTTSADPQASALRMPDRIDLVREAIARLDVDKTRSAMVKLDTPAMEQLCLDLVDPKLPATEAWRRLAAEIGQEAGDPTNDPIYKQVVRFGHRFAPIYAQVRREHANRIARLSVAQASNDNTDVMHRVGVHRLMEIIAEDLVQTDSADAVSPSRISNAIAALEGYSRGQIKAAELELRRQEAVGREEKLRADISKIESEIHEKRLRLKDRIDKLTDRIDLMGKAAKTGRTIGQDQIDLLRTEAAAMRRELIADAGEERA